MRRTLAVVVGIACVGGVLVGTARWGVERALNRVTQPPARVAASALAVHRSLDVVDLHADPLLWARDPLERVARGHVDLPRLAEGGVALQVFGVVTKSPFGQNFERTRSRSDMNTLLVVFQGRPWRTWGSLFERALDQAARLREAAARSGGALRVVRTRADLEELLAARAAGVVGGLLGLEGLHAAEGRADRLTALFEAGFRMAAPTHFFDNEVAGSAHGEVKGGLTSLGRQLLARMESLGMVVDLAHASPKAVDEVLALATRPVVFSHTGVQGTCPGPRNLSDAQLKAVARRGGVVGIGFFPGAVCGDDVAAIVRAVQHAIRVAGVEHVAFGSDWDGATTTPFDAAGLPQLTEALLAAGIGGADLAKIAGENALRVLRAILPAE